MNSRDCGDTADEPKQHPLAGTRVLDLTDARGEIAGRILADLGADVVKIEPPGGVNSRQLPPWDDSGNSLFWASYGIGKSCILLDLYNPGDKSTFLSLVEFADILLESFDPGYAANLGIDEKVLMKLNPRLVYVAITAFGRHGPKSSWPASNLTLEAAGGRLSIQGDPDREPLPVGYPQAWLHAGAQAAADSIIALNEREHSQLGQFLDLSCQEAIWWTLMAAQGTPVCLGTNPPGSGDDRGDMKPTQGPRTVSALDGLVTIAPGASPPGTRTMYSFAIDEAKQRGESNDELDAVDWDNWMTAYRDGQLTPELMTAASKLLDAYVERRTKLELIEWAMNNNLRLGPLNTTKDLLEFPQYRERGFFDDDGRKSLPWAWAHFSRTPLRKFRRTEASEVPSWTSKPSPAPGPIDTDARTGNAFEGLKVADFSWVAAGPTIAKALADHGATVVKIESSTRPDLSRTLAPHIDGKPGLNRSYWSFLYATSKLSLQCNLSTDAGKRLARSMCDWADVVIESFSTGTMKKMGLDYETLSDKNPDLIMLSTSMLGQTGAFSRYAGFGQQASGFSGFHYITGWPDRTPCGVATPYTDVVAPKFGIAAIGAAILERRRSGRGQYIDLAQAESSMLFLAPYILDESANGHTAERMGFDSIYTCPQGVYSTLGTERYIAIAAETVSQWHALCALIPEFPFVNAEYDIFERRWNDRVQINAAIAAWTAHKDPFALERQLTAAGIPASVVQRPLDVFADPQIEARGIKQVLPHTECGDVVHYGFCTRFSSKPQMIRFAPPCIGEHNELVLREFLKLTDEEINELERQGALE
ncbi:MAG: CoA transferase [Pseudomonadales bacterium]